MERGSNQLPRGLHTTTKFKVPWEKFMEVELNNEKKPLLEKKNHETKSTINKPKFLKKLH
jgi:hypothetical protein